MGHMDAIPMKQRPGVQLRQSLVLVTGALLSTGGKIAPRLFASVLMRKLFSPVKTKISGRAKKILCSATTECNVIGISKVTYYIWGNGDKRVLLVHGWSGNSGHMTAFAEPLVAAGFQVVAIDLPGHGESNGKYSSVLHFASAISNAKDRFGSFHAIVAHSLGAAAATYAFARGLECERAVFFSPVASYRSVWSNSQRLLRISPQLMNLAIKRAESWLNISFNDIEPAALAPRLSTELLVIHDKYDKQCPISDSERLVRLWPNAKLIDTGKLGHTRILSDEEMVRKTVDFVRAGA